MCGCSDHCTQQMVMKLAQRLLCAIVMYQQVEQDGAATPAGCLECHINQKITINPAASVNAQFVCIILPAALVSRSNGQSVLMLGSSLPQRSRIARHEVAAEDFMSVRVLVNVATQHPSRASSPLA